MEIAASAGTVRWRIRIVRSVPLDQGGKRPADRVRDAELDPIVLQHAERNRGLNVSEIADCLSPAKTLLHRGRRFKQYRCPLGLFPYPRPEAVGHPAFGAPLGSGGDRHDDVKRMAQPITRSPDLGHEGQIFAKRHCVHAADRAVDRRAHREATAGVIVMTRPRVMVQGIDKRRQFVAKLTIPGMQSRPMQEPRTETRFFDRVTDDAAADDVGARCNGLQVCFDPGVGGRPHPHRS